MSWLPGLLVLVAIYILGLSFAWQRRQKALQQWAIENNFDYQLSVLNTELVREFVAPWNKLYPFTSSVQGRVRHLLQGQVSDAALLLFQYSFSSGGRMKYFRVAIIKGKPMPGWWEVIKRDRMDGLLSKVAGKGLEVGDPQFEQVFRIIGSDVGELVTLTPGLRRIIETQPEIRFGFAEGDFVLSEEGMAQVGYLNRILTLIDQIATSQKVIDSEPNS